MGARQTKRSVDISTTPKKDKDGVAEEKLEKIEDQDLAKVQNGTAHSDNQETGAGDNAMVNGEGGGGNDGKVDDAKEVKETEDTPTTPETKTTEEKTETDEKPSTDNKTVTTPEQEKPAEKTEAKSDKKKKEKSKMKWSFRSISFSKKDKSKPNMSREDSKTGDLAKEAAVPEVAEVAETKEKTPSESTPKTEEAVSPVSNDDAKLVPTETTTTTAAPPPVAAAPAVPAVPAPVVPAPTTLLEDLKSSSQSSTTVVSTVQEVLNTSINSNECKKDEIVKEESSTHQEIIEKVVETSSTLVTKVTEQSSMVIKSTQHVQELVEMKSEEIVVPPLPASPPPTEAPPPTPVAPQPLQPEHEEVNGGGESMAELLPEENGLGPDAKLEDEDEVVPKVNGHHDDSPVKQVVDSIIDTIKTPEPIEKMMVTENIVEITTKETTVEE